MVPASETVYSTFSMISHGKRANRDVDQLLAGYPRRHGQRLIRSISQ